MRALKPLFLSLFILATLLQPLLAMGHLADIYPYNASSISVIVGGLEDGQLNSTFTVDGDWYNVSEVAGTPGLDIRFNFTGVTGDPISGCIDIYHTYQGHSQHEVVIQVRNFTSGTWYQIGTIIYNETAGWECSGLGKDPGHFFINGTMWARFYHEALGHAPHELQLDDIDLNVALAYDLPATGKYYAMAIILLILGLLLGIGMRRKR